MYSLPSILLAYMFWFSGRFAVVLLFDYHTLLLVSHSRYVLLVVYFLYLLCVSLSQGVLLDELPHNIVVVLKLSL